MPLKLCYVCNTEISAKAIVCPKCGEPLWKWKIPFLKQICTWILLSLPMILFCIVCSIYAFFKSFIYFFMGIEDIFYTDGRKSHMTDTFQNYKDNFNKIGNRLFFIWELKWWKDVCMTSSLAIFLAERGFLDKEKISRYLDEELAKHRQNFRNSKIKKEKEKKTKELLEELESIGSLHKDSKEITQEQYNKVTKDLDDNESEFIKNKGWTREQYNKVTKDLDDIELKKRNREIKKKKKKKKKTKE
jgi:hypothetical protein